MVCCIWIHRYFSEHSEFVLRRKKGFLMIVKAYKFRSLRWNDCPYAQEIARNRLRDLVSGKLYCSNWLSLNDVLEGVYRFSTEDLPQKRILEIEKKILSFKKKLFVFCASVATRNRCPLTDPLMWAHYADDHTGVAVELNLDLGRSRFAQIGEKDVESLFGPNPVRAIKRKVHYCRSNEYNYPIAEITKENVDEKTAWLTACEALLRKTVDWRHESELRILSLSKTYEINVPERVSRVILGCRMNEDQERSVRSLLEDFHKVEVVSTRDKNENQLLAAIRDN